MTHLEEVTIPERAGLEDYAALMPARIAALRRTAADLHGLAVCHINATPLGGGVAEMMGSQVRLERELGLDSRWFVIADAPAEFFAVTKKMHNLLQGRTGDLTDAERSVYAAVNAELAAAFAELLPRRPCIAVIHDPQPATLTGAVLPDVPTIFRLHIDLSTPNADAVEFLRPHIQAASRVVHSNAAYAASMPWLKRGQGVISYPAIDPFTAKNKPMPLTEAWDILERFGINPERPLIAQVSRFDPWKDPLGVISAYTLAKRRIPGLQLLLAGFMMAQDDPEAAAVFAEVQRQAEGDPDIFLFADPARLGGLSNDTFVSTVYTASTAIVQKSTREGFGLTMTEAMWKAKPVIAGNTAGAAVQIKHDTSGLIVNSPEEAAEAIVRLMQDEPLRERMGRAAQATVRQHFLMPRLVGDFLKLYTRLRPKTA